MGRAVVSGLAAIADWLAQFIAYIEVASEVSRTTFTVCRWGQEVSETD
jgi:hypothetical protein